MSDGTPRTFSAALRGAGASEMTLGGIDLLRSGLIKGVDIYLEAGQSPQVVIRPILLDQVTVDLTAGDLDGKAPRYKVAPDVAFLLEELGWAAPETVETSQYTLANLKRELQEARERITALEYELESAAQVVEQAQTDKAQMAEELANVNGHLEDLKLANATLLQELESAQAEAASAGKHPYDPAA